MMLHVLCVGEEAGARNRVFFPCKVAAAGDERYLVCAVAAAVVSVANCSSYVFCNEFFLPVCVVLCVS